MAGYFIGTLVQRIRRQADAAAMSADNMVRVTDLAHQLAAVCDGPAARTALSEGARRVTHANSCTLWEPSPDGLCLTVTTSSGHRPTIDQVAVKANRSGLITAFQTAQPATDPPASASEFTADRQDSASMPRLWQPIVHESRVIAVLELGWIDAAFLRDASTLAMARLLAVEAAVTLQRVDLLTKLEAMARTDELTGLPNRRAWQERLQLELARAARANESLSVAMIDLDHFKRYNDAHGHQAGDRLLTHVAHLWSTELREGDLLARYGGEEFALALPACPIDQALDIVQRFRMAIPDGQHCSAGLATWNGTDSADELLNRADHALYDAKRSGRNRTALASSSPPESAPAPGSEDRHRSRAAPAPS